MNEALHPSTLSEILDRTAQIYRSRFLVFLGIAVIPTAVLVVFGGATALALLRLNSGDGRAASPALVGIFVIAFACAFLFVVLPALLACTALATAAMNHAASRAFLGQPINIRSSYKAVWARGWRYIGLFTVQIVAVWVLPFGAWFTLLLVAAGLAALAQTAGVSGAGMVVFAELATIVGLVVYGFWMALRLSLAFPACAVEQIGAWDGLRRSFTLTKGTRGRILLLYLLGVALNWILSIAVLLPFVIVLSLMPGANSPAHAQTVGMVTLCVVYGSGFAVQAFTRPVYGIALMLFYYDQRIRQEAFDIEWMMLQAGLVVPQAPQPQAQPWLPPSTAGIGPDKTEPVAAEIAAFNSSDGPVESDANLTPQLPIEPHPPRTVIPAE